ncbi:Flp pilus assembly protein TadG [Oceanisphaera litoralis]|uniref:TadE/TadG family type IV pilus assembly protein n=1 Tax=Oceanisphaera litoralis TaxID=225144 RepID=UPI00195B86C4|nr:TadE family protein [Oceanisphaera litoralis]MBM7454241.1 Flp pilus assembly protein TadG [Oceanisphaera litoralis]
MNITPEKKRTVRKQRGTTTVEFSIVAGVIFLVLFSVMELGRLIYNWSMLNESSRQAARLAAVCMPDERQAVADDVAARLDIAMGSFNGSNINIRYLTDGMATVSNPQSNLSDIRYVQASIVGYTFQPVLPLPTNLAIQSPDFTTTLRAESLGRTTSGDIPCFP